MTKEYLSDYVKGQERHPYSEPEDSLITILWDACCGLMVGTLCACAVMAVLLILWVIFMITWEAAGLAWALGYLGCLLIGASLGLKHFT